MFEVGLPFAGVRGGAPLIDEFGARVTLRDGEHQGPETKGPAPIRERRP